MSTTMHSDIHLTDMGHQCAYCQGRSFRRSRLKGADWGSLLAMRYPVRCLSCSQRQSVGMRVALRSMSSSVKQVRTSKSAASQMPGLTEKQGGLPAERPLGGGSFPSVKAQQPTAMPDLRGIVLEHHAAVQHETPAPAARREKTA